MEEPSVQCDIIVLMLLEVSRSGEEIERVWSMWGKTGRETQRDNQQNCSPFLYHPTTRPEWTEQEERNDSHYIYTAVVYY